MTPPLPDAWRRWPPTTDAVENAQNGDHGELSDIVTAGIPKLVGFYRGLGLRSHDAEDLASDTCEAIVRNLPRLRDAARFEAWFWKIARNKYHDHLRRNRRTFRGNQREEILDPPDEPLVIEAEHEAVRRAFTRLSSRDRELLWLRDVVGLAYSDIAGRLGATEGSLRIAVMRARQRLEQTLEEEEGS